MNLISFRPVRLLAVFGAIFWIHGPNAHAGPFFPFGHHTGYLVTQQAPLQAVQFAPISQVQFAPVTSQLAPMSQVQLAPMSQVRLAPMSQVQLAPMSQVQLAATTQSLQAPGASMSAEDQDYWLLSQGFGGRLTSVRAFEDFIKGEADRQLKRGGLNRQEVATLLMEAAKGFLASQGFGFVGPLVDPVIKRVIDRVISGRSTPGIVNEPPPANQPATVKPDDVMGGGYKITGTVYVIPSPGTGVEKVDQITPPVPTPSVVTPTPPPVVTPNQNQSSLITLPTADQNASSAI